MGKVRLHNSINLSAARKAVSEALIKSNSSLDINFFINTRLKSIRVHYVFYKYYNFDLEANWTASLGNIEQEPYTDWETKTEYVNGSSYTRQVPVTKYKSVVRNLHQREGHIYTKSNYTYFAGGKSFPKGIGSNINSREADFEASELPENILYHAYTEKDDKAALESSSATKKAAVAKAVDKDVKSLGFDHVQGLEWRWGTTDTKASPATGYPIWFAEIETPEGPAQVHIDGTNACVDAGSLSVQKEPLYSVTALIAIFLGAIHPVVFSLWTLFALSGFFKGKTPFTKKLNKYYQKELRQFRASDLPQWKRLLSFSPLYLVLGSIAVNTLVYISNSSPLSVVQQGLTAAIIMGTLFLVFIDIRNKIRANRVKESLSNANWLIPWVSEPVSDFDHQAFHASVNTDQKDIILQGQKISNTAVEAQSEATASYSGEVAEEEIRKTA